MSHDKQIKRLREVAEFLDTMPTTSTTPGVAAAMNRTVAEELEVEDGIQRANIPDMTPTSFTNVQEAATALDLKINVLQNSAGVLSDVDQAALTDIETASKHLLQTVNDLTRFQPKSAGQIEAVIQDRAVRPGETPAEHTARMQRDYPYSYPARVASNNPKVK